MCHILRVRVPKDIGAFQLATLARVKEIQINFPSNLSELDNGTTCIFVIPVHKYLLINYSNTPLQLHRCRLLVTSCGEMAPEATQGEEIREDMAEGRGKREGADG